VEYRWTKGGGRVDNGWRLLTSWISFVCFLQGVSLPIVLIKEVKKRNEIREVYSIFSLFKGLILNILFAILINFQAKSKFIYSS